jgi:prevent-host-death family protein
MTDKEMFTGENMASYTVKTVSIHEAKTNFSKLVKRAEAGETIYIGAYGKPSVTLTAANQKKINAELRKGFFGCMKGKIVFNEGWDAPMTDEEIEEFHSMRGLEDFEVK